MVTKQPLCKEDLEEILSVNAKTIELQLKNAEQFEDIINIAEKQVEENKKIQSELNEGFDVLSVLSKNNKELNLNISTLNKNIYETGLKYNEIEKYLSKHMVDEEGELELIKENSISNKNSLNNLKEILDKIEHSTSIISFIKDDIKSIKGELINLKIQAAIAFGSGVLTIIAMAIKYFLN